MKIEVVPYNPEWRQKYLRAEEAIKKAGGDNIFIIEHVGSTSIEGLSAKPIIDIFIGTKSLEQADNLIKPMVSLGYEYVEYMVKDTPFRRYFRKHENGIRTHQVHITPADHPFRNHDFIFKDFITVNEPARKEYEDFKIGLSKKEWNDYLEYNIAKDEICLRIKNDALNYFGAGFEETESEATYLMYKYASNEAMRKASFSLLREGRLTAIRSDIFPGFSVNRALGITKIDEDFLTMIEEFYRGKKGKFALQIPPAVLNVEKKELLGSRGYSYANSWVTFYRDSSPVQTRGTDLEIKETGTERSSDFAFMLNEVFSFPHELDDITASIAGRGEWVTFMAFDNGKPAGSASVCVTGENAYLSFANVLPEYRRRGVQGELLKRRIDAARTRGAKWIFVDTAENSAENPNPSYWNMLRYGFRLMYHRPNYVKIQE